MWSSLFCDTMFSHFQFIITSMGKDNLTAFTNSAPLCRASVSTHRHQSTLSKCKHVHFYSCSSIQIAQMVDVWMFLKMGHLGVICVQLHLQIALFDYAWFCLYHVILTGSLNIWLYRYARFSMEDGTLYAMYTNSDPHNTIPFKAQWFKKSSSVDHYTWERLLWLHLL